MKKWLTIMISSMLCAVGAMAASESVDTWDMNDNGLSQISDNGINLGGHYATNNNQFAQVDDDGTFILAPTTIPQGYGAKIDLSSAADLTAGVVTLSCTYSSLDWSTNAALNSKFGFRIYDPAAIDYVGLEFLDSGDKIFAFAKSSAGLGGIDSKAGRVVNGLAGSDSRTVTIELDYANGEIRTAGNWQWSADGQITFTNAVDFAGAGVTSISKVMTYYANWSLGDRVTVDNLSVERFVSDVAPEGVYIADSTTYEFKNVAETNTFASLSVTNGDYIVVEASVNKGTWDDDEITFDGSATLGAVTYGSFSGAGPEANLWYMPVTSTGTVDVILTATVADNTTAFSSLGAYVVRSSTGGLDILGQASVGSLTNDTSLLGLAYTNIYDFGASSTGLLFEAAASYMSDDNGISSDNPGYVFDLSDPGLQRKVGHAEFSGVSAMTNIWTGTTNRQAAVFGVAFAAGVPSNPTSEYNTWLSGHSVGAETGLQDDADNDLLDNLTEYAWGGEPDNASVNGNTPVRSRVADGGTNYLQYIYFERSDAAARGLSSSLEVGTDLVYTNWTTSGIEFVGSGASAEPGYNAVTNRISTDDDDKRFLNLKIQFIP